MEKSGLNKTIDSDKKITRRDFLDYFIKAGFFGLLAGMAYPALNYLNPVTRQGPVGGLADVGAADEVPLWGAKKYIVAGSAIMVIHTPQGFKALSAICTHLGCLVGWDEQRHEIVCPCHAGRFDIEGAKISGPPPRGLAAYHVNVVQGRLMVQV